METLVCATFVVIFNHAFSYILTVETMGDEMGISGMQHEDLHDAAMSLSNMTVLSDIDVQGEPGRFHLTSLGVYVQLFQFSTIFFSGRLPHGGTPPLGPPGKLPAPWSTRCVVIGYPSGSYVNGILRQAIAVVPYQKHPLYLTPEMVGVK